MKILITGIAGFIGSHLAEHLQEQGHSVYGVDNFSTGKRENLNQLSRLNTNDCDCRDLEKMKFIVQRKKPEFIFHLASTVGVNRVLADPKDCIENNIESLRNVLSFGIPGIFASTSEVYGKTETPLSEDTDIIFSSKNRWSYAASKLIGEWLALAEQWNVVRFFNVIGPRQSHHYGAVVPRFIKQALSNEPLTVYGSGGQVRTFIDVRDCVGILGSLIDKKFGVVNIGGEHATTIDDLAVDIASELNPKVGAVRVRYKDAYQGEFEDCLYRVPDLTKMHTLVGFKKLIPFKKTVRDIAESMKGVMPGEPIPTKPIDTRASSVVV